MFKEIFKKLLQERNVTAYQINKATGISNGLLSDYKTGAKQPSIENLTKIADYFNVSTDYLLGKTDIKTKIDDDITFDDFSFAMYNETKDLSEEQKNDLLEMARIFKKHLKEKNKG